MIRRQHKLARSRVSFSSIDLKIWSFSSFNWWRSEDAVEFYFSDSNLPYDKFMWTLHTKSESHYVPIATVSSFKRMREYLPKGLDWIANALRNSDVLEVDAEAQNVRRKTEVKPPVNVLDRSVYAKGFGTDDKGGELQKELEKLFSKWGTVVAVRLRREKDKQFKVS